MDVTFKKTLTGRLIALYNCPDCNSPLKSPVEDISTEDECPKCSNLFIVPGEKEFQKLLESRKQKQQLDPEQKQKMKDSNQAGEISSRTSVSNVNSKVSQIEDRVKPKNDDASQNNNKTPEDSQISSPKPLLEFKVEPPANEPFKVKKSIVGNRTIVELYLTRSTIRPL